MSAISTTFPNAEWRLPDRGHVGMWCLIAAESAIFAIFVVAYIYYLGKSLTGPKPEDVLRTPIFFTICLLSSSLTVHLADRNLVDGRIGAFRRWWLLTIALGAAFLFGTAREWRHLIVEEHLTISTNLFGTTYYSLVGLHALHVTVGLIALGTVAILASLGYLSRQYSNRISVLSLYWHFVDAVWVVVFTTVYIVGV